MSRHYKLRLQDILDAIEKIQRYVADFSADTFKTNEQLVDSVTMNLFIIGEAANRIPTDIQDHYSEIDWRNIIGLRNIVAHEYFRINLDRIWDVIAVEIPLLQTQVQKILEEQD
jgi:uncharacterized protein with HEPN domain